MPEEWKLPYQGRMINDRDPGHIGPVGFCCAEQYVDRLNRAESSPMLTSPYGGKPYESPHAGTYRHGARVVQWACASGQHGPVTFR